MNSKFKKIFIIAGNHEFYNNRKDIENTKLKIKEICDLDGFENITFLDNSYEDYGGYRFMGSIIWTHISKREYLINDTRMKGFGY
jgi:hypothetical protein